VSPIHFAVALRRGLGTLLFSSSFLTPQQNVSPPYTSSTTSTRAILSPQASSFHAFSRRTASYFSSVITTTHRKRRALPRVRRCWLRKFSPVYIDYFCLYCILSGLPAGHIISLTVLGFVVLFGAHPLPILKFPVSLPMQTLFSFRIVPPLSSSSRGEVDSLHSFLSVPIPSLSYSFTLTLLPLLGRRLFLHRMAALSPNLKFTCFFSRP